MKVIDSKQRMSFADLGPSSAKKKGRHVTLRHDWEKVKEEYMYQIVKAKFIQNPAIADALLETGNALLIEGNTWGDTIWGMCNGRGQNKLGKILMRVRSEIA
jgi:ribA/ribD-fused uncharacterized protein